MDQLATLLDRSNALTHLKVLKVEEHSTVRLVAGRGINISKAAAILRKNVQLQFTNFLLQLVSYIFSALSKKNFFFIFFSTVC